MTLCEAVTARINELCKERSITVYKLAKVGGLNKNTLYQIKDCGTVTLDTINAICETLDIPLETFFNSEIFNPENLT